LIEHEKYVTGFSDFLSSLAGMMGFLFEILTAIVGSFIFWQQMKLRCFDLYTEENDPLRETPLYTSGFSFYVRNLSAISCFFTPCNKEDNKKQLEALESMQERIDEDLDQMQVMLTIREAKKLLETKKGPDSFIKPTPKAEPTSVDVLPVGDQVTLKKANETDVEQQNGEIKEEQAPE
jgi:hypothetical protein